MSCAATAGIDNKRWRSVIERTTDQSVTNGKKAVRVARTWRIVFGERLLTTGGTVRFVCVAQSGKIIAQVLCLDITHIHIAQMLKRLFKVLHVAFEHAVAQSFGGYVLDEASAGFR